MNKGCLRIFNTDGDADEHNISFCPEKWWAADIASFFDQSPAFYSIGALEDTEFFYMSFAVVEKLFADVPKFERFFASLLKTDFTFINAALPPIYQKQPKHFIYCFKNNTLSRSSV